MRFLTLFVFFSILFGCKTSQEQLKEMNYGTYDIEHTYGEAFDVANYDNWKKIYHDTEEMVPDKEEIPEPKRFCARITMYKDTDHAHNLLTRRSVTGILLFINNTPVK